MTSPQQLEILDLRHFSAKQLRPLLERECRLWLTRLRWNYSGSTELLLQYLDSRILPGFVALAKGKICGFTFCVYEGEKAVIGDIFASPDHPAPLTVVHTLAGHLGEMLLASPDITRIEAQLLLYDSGTLGPAFAAARPTVFPRLFLERECAAGGVARTAVPAGFELFRWSPAFYDAAAELIYRAYLGHIDAGINDQYRSLAGSLRFLHNVIRFPGCGTFDADASFALRERRTGALAGIVLCSRIGPDVAHITQLCVAPGLRNLGLGGVLLGICMNHLPTLSYRALTLTVSEANEAAVRLYMSAGFRTRQRFDALVIDKAGRVGPRLVMR